MPKETPAFLYAISSGDEVKIGYSGNPERRRMDVCGKYSPTRIIKTQWTETPRADERLLHWMLKSHHRRADHFRQVGEWFTIEEQTAIDLIESVPELRGTVPVPDTFSLFAYVRRRYRRGEI